MKDLKGTKLKDLLGKIYIVRWKYFLDHNVTDKEFTKQ